MHEDNRIMLVEDFVDFRRLLAAQLRSRHLEVLEFDDGIQARDFLARESPGVVLLDMNLPQLDGIELLKWLRSQGNQAAVIMISGSEEELDRVLCLELGADDFLVKPFSARELLARIRAVQRRRKQYPVHIAQDASSPTSDSAEPSSKILRAGKLLLDPERHHLECDGQAIELTAIEFRLLLCFMRHPKRVFSRSQLLDAAWGRDYVGYEQAVNNHILRLRRKIGDANDVPRHIQTVKGVGYRFEP
ncbi:MAG: DNA-binding response regulator [Betaproteobacteria bacterium]|nr:response regulator transcription factor [Pseudomonadota bacterium]NBO11863.1 DNA-binding response regulator [Betaproteobacteria bacterium]NBO43774.1 DNA-binding response regulator [Betaproteobacteria bacterium]NBP10500.1 DNA-binding response regulator [Betaproteobacteria bacterium]NBP61438.1 DNA-binding response regulator [Betaproteobacteria bacterium]